MYRGEGQKTGMNEIKVNFSSLKWMMFLVCLLHKLLTGRYCCIVLFTAEHTSASETQEVNTANMIRQDEAQS